MTRETFPASDSPPRADGDGETATRLVALAKRARNYAVCTTNGSTIGAAVRLEDGTIATGTDIIGDTSSSSVHAEEIALGSAIRHRSDPDRTPKVTHIALVSDTADLLRPCPDCKIPLKKHATEDTKLVLDNGNSREVVDFLLRD